MRDLPVRKIWGIGPKSAERFAVAGYPHLRRPAKFSLPEMVERHGKWGEDCYHLCRGHDNREVQPNRIRKSLSNEETYFENLETLEDCRAADGQARG